MHNDQLKSLVNERVAEGRQGLSFVNRSIVYKDAPALFDLLDYENDDIFLEPILFQYSHLSDELQNLPQIMFGYLADDQKPELLTVLTNKKGTAYIPKFGHIYTDAANTKITLNWDRDQKRFVGLRDSGYQLLRTVSAQYRGGFEIYQDEIVELNHYFGIDHSREDLGVAAQYKLHEDEMDQSFRVIKSIYPEFHQVLNDALKSFYLFKTKTNRSFATIQSMGISYLNVEDENGLIFFLEDIIHQSAHNIFYYVLADEDVFSVNPTDPMSLYSSHPNAHGDVYGTFHGLFTLTNITEFLSRCIAQNTFDGLQHLEVQGRISDNMKRFKTALEVFDERKIYTDLGWELYGMLKASYESVYQENHELIASFETSNQPYVFSFKKFLEANPVVAQ